MLTATMPTATKAPSYNYQDTLAASQRVNWRVEDIIGGDKTLDFTRPFLPEALARTTELKFLNQAERRIFNQSKVTPRRADGQRIVGAWEICHDGETWEHDFEIGRAHV